MKCPDVDKVKPLDRLLDDQIREFESGGEKECDKELDRMIWTLGKYENQESLQEAEEFVEDPQIEEELVEKRMIRGRNGQTSFIEGEGAEEILPGEKEVMAHSISPVNGRSRMESTRGNRLRKNKK